MREIPCEVRRRRAKRLSCVCSTSFRKEDPLAGDSLRSTQNAARSAFHASAPHYIKTSLTCIIHKKYSVNIVLRYIRAIFISYILCQIDEKSASLPSSRVSLHIPFNPFHMFCCFLPHISAGRLSVIPHLIEAPPVLELSLRNFY